MELVSWIYVSILHQDQLELYVEAASYIAGTEGQPHDLEVIQGREVVQLVGTQDNTDYKGWH